MSHSRGLCHPGIMPMAAPGACRMLSTAAQGQPVSEQAPPNGSQRPLFSIKSIFRGQRRLGSRSNWSVFWHCTALHGGMRRHVLCSNTSLQQIHTKKTKNSTTLWFSEVQQPLKKNPATTVTNVYRPSIFTAFCDILRYIVAGMRFSCMLNSCSSSSVFKSHQVQPYSQSRLQCLPAILLVIRITGW